MEEGIKPYFIFNNDEMELLIQKKPKTREELIALKGFGPKKLISSYISSHNCFCNCLLSFHGTLKKEEVHLVTYLDFSAARLAVFEYIESWYTIKRLHGSIGYITPQKCEDLARKSA